MVWPHPQAPSQRKRTQQAALSLPSWALLGSHPNAAHRGLPPRARTAFPAPGFPDVYHQCTWPRRDVAPARVIGRCQLLGGTWAATSAAAIVLPLNRVSICLSSPLCDCEWLARAVHSPAAPAANLPALSPARLAHGQHPSARRRARGGRFGRGRPRHPRCLAVRFEASLLSYFVPSTSYSVWRSARTGSRRVRHATPHSGMVRRAHRHHPYRERPWPPTAKARGGRRPGTPPAARCFDAAAGPTRWAAGCAAGCGGPPRYLADGRAGGGRATGGDRVGRQRWRRRCSARSGGRGVGAAAGPSPAQRRRRPRAPAEQTASGATAGSAAVGAEENGAPPLHARSAAAARSSGPFSHC